MSSCGVEGPAGYRPLGFLALAWRPHIHHFVLPGALWGDLGMLGVAPLAESRGTVPPACAKAIGQSHRACALGYSSDARHRPCERFVVTAVLEEERGFHGGERFVVEKAWAPH